MFSQNGLQKHAVNKWNERDVCRWLKDKGFRRVLRHFRDNKVDGKILLQVSSQYLDGLGVINQPSRDKLLAAIHELKLFGGSLPEEKHFRLNAPGTNGRTLGARFKKRSLPARPSDMQHIIKGMLPDVSEQGSLTPELKRSSSWMGPEASEVPGRKTPQEVLQERTEQLSSQHIEKGEVEVYAPGLLPEEQSKTIEITNQTTSKQLVRLVLEQCDAVSKDSNLFYIAVEIGIKKKDSSLLISQMMVLPNDARPLEIQSSQPSGEAKFHLKMRSGGLLRVHAGILSPGATYKCVQIARQTRTDEVVQMVLSSYGCEEPTENFALVESSTDFEVGRILAEEECPLQVQSQWKAEEQKVFTLARDQNKPVPPSDDTHSEISYNEINKQNEAVNTLQVETRMEHEKQHEENETRQASSPASELEENECIEEVRKRRTSIEALDLESVSQKNRKVSQIDKFRYKFHEFHRKSNGDESDISDESSKKRKVSQIDVFRSKFLAYYSGKVEGPGSMNLLNGSEHKLETNTGDASSNRKKSSASSDEDLPRFSSSPPTFLRDKRNMSNNFCHENVKAESKETDLNTASKKPQVSLASILQHSKLIAVTITRQPGEDWGLELVHVTKTGSLMGQNQSGQKEEEKVVYVLHSGNGQNSVLSNSSGHDISSDAFTPSGTSTPLSVCSSGSSEHEMSSILGTSSHSSIELDSSMNDMRHMVHKQNLKRRIGVSLTMHPTTTPPDTSPLLSRSCSTDLLSGPINPLPQRPSSALAQWRSEGSPQSRPGVRIVGMTGGGVADRSGELAVDDLIIEINGCYVINSPLEPVIAALQAANTVSLVVSRAQSPEPKTQEKENKTDYKDDIKELTLQIQNLVTKVSEMQTDMKKKDDKIRFLKKMVKKNSDGKTKLQETVHVLV